MYPVNFPYIEREAVKLQETLTVKYEPNGYEYSSLKAFFEKNGWQFEYDVDLKDTQNTMKDTFTEMLLRYTLKYNLIKNDNKKILQFDIGEPCNENSTTYRLFLLVVFYEYWGELKQINKYRDFSNLYDYAAFSRAMLIPDSNFYKHAMTHPEFPNKIDVGNLATIYKIPRIMILERIEDYGYDYR